MDEGRRRTLLPCGGRVARAMMPRPKRILGLPRATWERLKPSFTFPTLAMVSAAWRQFLDPSPTDTRRPRGAPEHPHPCSSNRLLAPCAARLGLERAVATGHCDNRLDKRPLLLLAQHAWGLPEESSDQCSLLSSSWQRPVLPVDFQRSVPAVLSEQQTSVMNA